MATGDDQKQSLIAAAEHILTALSEVVRAARTSLAGGG
jgi:hypothetical protein